MISKSLKCIKVMLNHQKDEVKHNKFRRKTQTLKNKN